MPSKLITTPTQYPVTRDELVKVHIKVDGTLEDSLLDIYLAAATEQVEDYIQRQLMQATWEWQMANWYCDPQSILRHYSNASGVYLKLTKAPLISVASVKYDDASNVEQTLDTTEYQVDTTSEPGRIRFIGSLPEVFDKPNAIRIRYVAGYGASGADVTAQRLLIPSRAKIGILRGVADLYENRQDETAGTTFGKLSVDTLAWLSPLRLFL